MKILSIAVLLLMSCFSMRPAQASHGEGNAHCLHAVTLHIPCVIGVTDDAHWLSNVAVSATAPPMPFQGNTIATVSAAFPTVLEWAWRNGSAATLNAKMTAIPDLELARLSHLYELDSKSQITPLLMLASQKLTAANLVKLRAAFGVATDAEVVTYAPAAVKSAYLAAAKRVSIKQSRAAHIDAKQLSRTVNALPYGTPAPSVWMTPYEIYEEYFWTLPAEFAARDAAFLAAKFMATKVAGVASWAYTVGSAIYAFGEKVNPQFGPDIITVFGTLSSMPDGSPATEYGSVGEVSGYGYIDGPITEVDVGGGGGGGVEMFRLED